VAEDREYLDFELSIDARGDGQYEVAARSPSGDGRATVSMSLSAADIESVIFSAHKTWRGGHGDATREVRRSTPLPQDSEGGLRDIGTRLFEAVMTGKVGQRYRSSYDRALSQKQGLRLRLRIQAPEIAALPWEYLFDPDHEHFVARTNMTSIVRYVEVDTPADSLHVDFPLRVLGVIAGPTDQARLQKELEQARMEQALADLCQRGLVTLTWARGGTYDALSDALGDVRPHILHFIGHGGFDESRGEGTIILEREDCTSLPLPATNLGELLLGGGTVRLVVLNSCEGARSSGQKLFSSTAATVVRRGVPAVVAMQYPITDQAAVRFSHELYEKLAASQPVDRAVASARLHLHSDEPRSPEWGTPVLFLQSDSGLLFSTGVHKVPIAEARSAWSIIAASSVIAAAAMTAYLSFTSPAEAEVTGEVRSEEAAFRLDSAASFGASTTFRSALASSFANIDVPIQGAAPRRVTNADLEVRGAVRLDGSSEFPPGTSVRLRASGDDRISMEWSGRIPPIGLTLDGPVQFTSDGETTPQQYDVPARLNLLASANAEDSASAELEFEVPPGDSVVLEGPYLSRAIRFSRINRQFAQGSPARETSTVIGGSFRFSNGIERSVGEGYSPRIIDGRVDRVILASSAITVRFRLLVERDPGFPSRIQMMSTPVRTLWTVVTAVVGAFLGIAVVRLRRKESK
jgi:CHAT domain